MKFKVGDNVRIESEYNPVTGYTGTIISYKKYWDEGDRKYGKYTEYLVAIANSKYDEPILQYFADPELRLDAVET